jgi:hypothetical protein
MSFITITRRYGRAMDEAARRRFDDNLRAACWVSALGLAAAITAILCGIAVG